MSDSVKRSPSSDNLVWIDLEMTGLDVDAHVIVQAALIVTDGELNPLETYCTDIWQPESELAKMVPFVRKMHEKTGLLDRVRNCEVDLGRAEQELLQRVAGWCPYRPILCGNSIHADRRFIDRYMPALGGYLHYRMVDVSSLKVLSKLWYPGVEQFEKSKQNEHDALFDIQQSIDELKHYRETIFRTKGALPARPV